MPVDLNVDTPANRAVRARLEENIKELTCENQGLYKVLSFLRDITCTNIVVNWRALRGAGIAPDTPVSVNLHDVPTRRALVMVLSEAGGAGELAYTIDDDGIITISTRLDLSSETHRIKRVYDIHDLLPISATEQHISNIIGTIEATVAPDSWRDSGGIIGSIKELNGQLIINQTRGNHLEIRSLLSSLHKKAKEENRGDASAPAKAPPPQYPSPDPKIADSIGKVRERMAAILALSNQLVFFDGDMSNFSVSLHQMRKKNPHGAFSNPMFSKQPTADLTWAQSKEIQDRIEALTKPVLAATKEVDEKNNGIAQHLSGIIDNPAKWETELRSELRMLRDGLCGLHSSHGLLFDNIEAEVNGLSCSLCYRGNSLQDAYSTLDAARSQEDAAETTATPADPKTEAPSPNTKPAQTSPASTPPAPTLIEVDHSAGEIRFRGKVLQISAGHQFKAMAKLVEKIGTEVPYLEHLRATMTEPCTTTYCKSAPSVVRDAVKIVSKALADARWPFRIEPVRGHGYALKCGAKKTKTETKLVGKARVRSKGRGGPGNKASRLAPR